MTLNDLIDDYLAHLRDDRALAERTLRSYGQELRLFASVVGEGVAADELSRDHVLAYLNKEGPDGKPLNPSSRNRKLIVVRGFCTFLKERAHARKDASDGISWARVPRQERPSLSLADYRALLDALDAMRLPAWRQVRDRCLVQLLFHTGIRVAELVAIHEDQMDLEHAVITDLPRKGGGAQTIPLNHVAVTELRRWLSTRNKRDAQDEHVFIGRTGSGLGVRQVERVTKALGQQAEIPFPVTPHVIRHTFASELARLGVNMEIIRRLMNHRNIATTSRYTHVGLDALREAVELLGEKTVDA